MDGLLDSRFLHLCCPTLDHARQLFSATSGGGGQRPEQARRVKKIRPTAPSGAAAARAALAAPLAAPGQPDGAATLLKLQLQRAFWEQSSTDEHKVGWACWLCWVVLGGRGLLRGSGAERLRLAYCGARLQLPLPFCARAARSE